MRIELAQDRVQWRALLPESLGEGGYATACSVLKASCSVARPLYTGGYATASGLEVHYFQLLPRARIRGSIHPLPHTFSWRIT
jgi:hypothetical protein